MKITWKVVGNCLILILVLVSIVNLVNVKRILAVLNIPDAKYSIKNANSQLLRLLILPENLPKEFNWYSTSITQNSIPPTEEVDVIDGATSTLGGFYYSNEIVIVTQIKEYNINNLNSAPNVITYFDAKFLNPVPDKDLSNLRLVRVSNIQKYKCSHSVTNETWCSVGIILSDKTIFIETQVFAVLDKSSTEEFLNTLLNALNKKME